MAARTHCRSRSAGPSRDGSRQRDRGFGALLRAAVGTAVGGLIRTRSSAPWRCSIWIVADALLLAVDSSGGVAAMITLVGALDDLGVSARIAASSDFGDRVHAGGFSTAAVRDGRAVTATAARARDTELLGDGPDSEPWN